LTLVAAVGGGGLLHFHDKCHIKLFITGFFGYS
jgi:hypothetical protein